MGCIEVDEKKLDAILNNSKSEVKENVKCRKI